MEESPKLLNALRWIKNILENDIDLVIPEKDFNKVFEKTREYAT